ncbi:hypothetical protein NSA47_14415 [Irregularibacter muris]|uniref:Uncharacterized protein n=1 Tax=Irregularibacter muris TaxID=1796619 RepID=A0AAE3HK06_9FIRM|nr:hypothetical protein [Irregularibacter muris]MCR1900158.1 hypothetical protein [Irregularibacter muris]
MFKNNTNKRTIAMLLLIAFVFATSLSAVFLFTHADHEHDHHGPEGTCATCAQLGTVHHLLKNIFTTILASVTALSTLLILTITVNTVSPRVRFHTLVSLKVRLNN